MDIHVFERQLRIIDGRHRENTEIILTKHHQLLCWWLKVHDFTRTFPDMKDEILRKLKLRTQDFLKGKFDGKHIGIRTNTFAKKI